MAEIEIEQKYNEMLLSGDLSEMFPQFTGDWMEDKHEFSTFWVQNEMIINGDIDFDFDFEDY